MAKMMNSEKCLFSSFAFSVVLSSLNWQRWPPEDPGLHFIGLETFEKRAALPPHSQESVSCDPH